MGPTHCFPDACRILTRRDPHSSRLCAWRWSPGASSGSETVRDRPRSDPDLVRRVLRRVDAGSAGRVWSRDGSTLVQRVDSRVHWGVDVHIF